MYSTQRTIKQITKMKFDWFNRENKEEYEYLREDPSKLGPHVDHLQQTHPTDLYGDSTYKGKMPLSVRIYLGGLSVIGLYAVYRMLRKSSTKYI